MTAERIQVELSTDEMRAWLRIVPGEPTDRDELLAALGQAGVGFGVDADALAQVVTQLRDPEFAFDAFPIAHGRPAQSASNGDCALTLAVGLQAGHQLEDGSFDYRDRGLLTPVRAGQVVAHCEPIVQGVEGRTVTDRPIPCEPLRAAVDAPSFGDGLVRGPGGDIVAARDGVLLRDDGAAITLGDHYAHEGDVDLRSGHLDMQGELSISGDVTAKFAAQASRDVEIAKSVLRGTVYAGGSVRIRGGVVGTGGGVVMAEHDVAAEHGQGAMIRCGGTLHLRKAALNCELHASSIRVDGPVRGGRLYAERELIVGDAGARMGGEVELTVALELPRPIRASYDEERHERHLADRLGAQVLHTRAPLRDPFLPGSPEALAHAEHIHELALVAHIDVLGTIHPGCTIVIGAHRLVLDEAHRHTRFSIDPETHAIRIEPLP